MKNPWTNIYGVARTLVATGTLLTLLSNSSRALFTPAVHSVVENPNLLLRCTLFGITGQHFWLGHLLAVVGLLLVVSGWRPRITGILHWWITFSFSMACVAADGGDQVAHIFTFLMLPVTLTDPRRWHWQQAPELDSLRRTVLSRIALSAIFVARIQGAVIYFVAAVSKLAVVEWMNGTAIYYWLLDPRIGIATQHHGLVVTLFRPAFVAAVLSWAPIAVELALCFTLTMSSDNVLRKPLLIVGLVFHACNILFFGLTSFFCSMAAVLVMMVRPIEQPFSLLWAEPLLQRLRAQVQALAGRLIPGAKSRPDLIGPDSSTPSSYHPPPGAV